MSRTRRAIHGVATGYLSLTANIVYTMASIPLALHYLGKADFGLWALVTQVSGYLVLLDLGMSAAVSRLLVDHQENKDDGEYGSILQTGFLVFSLQGLLIALLGTGLSFVLPGILSLPTEQHHPFILLASSQCLCLGIGLAVRSVSAPLWGHQRYDIGNYSSLAWFAVSFLLLWQGFHMGWGIYSMVLPSIIGVIINLLVSGISVRKLNLLPSKGCWGKPSWKTFRETFRFGSDLFLFNLGWQFLSASEIIIITRMMGLESAAIWAVGTKLFVMSQQIIWKLFDYCAGGFSEMIVKNEINQLRDRFRDILVLTGSTSVFVGLLVAVLNQPFLLLWTHGQISWDSKNGWWMAVLLVTYSTLRCHSGLLGLRKKLGVFKYFYFIEGITYILLAICLIPYMGFLAIPISASLANIIISGSYGMKQTLKYFDISARVLSSWCKPNFVFMLTFGLVVCVVEVFVPPLGSEVWALIFRGLILGLSGGLLLILFGVTENLRKMILAIISRYLKPHLVVSD